MKSNGCAVVIEEVEGIPAEAGAVKDIEVLAKESFRATTTSEEAAETVSLRAKRRKNEKKMEKEVATKENKEKETENTEDSYTR